MPAHVHSFTCALLTADTQQGKSFTKGNKTENPKIIIGLCRIESSGFNGSLSVSHPVDVQ